MEQADRTKGMKAEGAVVKACMDYLKLRGAYVWRNNTGALKDKNNRLVYFGKVGSSDILGVLPGGRFIAVECKAPDGRLSDHQIEFLNEIERIGGVAVIAKSVDDIEKVFRRMADEKN
jgi:penicillin-binding protein-related factor A (putative recombinase)